MANRPDEQAVRAVHLSREVAAATDLLAAGLNLAASSTWRADQPGAAFTQLSQGVERVLKVTLLLSERNQGREADPKFLSGRGGHAIGEMNERVFDILTNESQQSAPYVVGIVAEAVCDPYWPYVVAALDRWAGAAGRYRDIDALAGKVVDGDQSWVPWEEAERRAIDEGSGWVAPSTRTLLAGRQRILLSIMRWWHTIFRSWQHGLVGDDGRAFASALDPQNPNLDSPIKALVAGR